MRRRNAPVDPSSIGRPMTDRNASSTAVSRTGTPPPGDVKSEMAETPVKQGNGDGPIPPPGSSHESSAAQAGPGDDKVEMADGDRLATVNREWAAGVAEGERRMEERLNPGAGAEGTNSSGTETPKRVEFEL